MNHLFSPFQIKNLTLKNRIVLPPLASFLIEKGGAITDRAVEHYRRRAAGGPAMVIMEACAVSPEGVVSENQARIDGDRLIKGLSRIAEAIRAEGAVPAIQIHHAGRQTSAKVIKRLPLAPSPLPCPAIRGDVAPLTVEQIQDLIKKFAEAAVRSREAGFELLEIHGAHGYLINQFLSRYSNIREDGYGGDIAGRTRFALDIISEIRNRLGSSFPISFKISAQEFVPEGLTVEESIDILKLLVTAGIDAVQVSAGNDSTPEWICQPMFMQKACLAESAAVIKKALQIPVMTVGRINDPWTADNIIAKGMADLVCIGRGLMADPEMPIKAQEGRFDEIRTCIACNTCMQSIYRKGRLECLVNPALGREQEMQIVPATQPKKVMVVGAGPGGLNAAWVAAKRGHEVHLYEKQSYLGGQLVPGSKTAYKREMQSLINFQKRQVELNGVICHMGQEVTAQSVQEENPDVVILATGSRPILPTIEGIDEASVVTFDVVLDGDVQENKTTVIIGGGSTGCEVAYHLSEMGSAVTIVELMPKIGGDIEAVTKKLLVRKLKENNVRILTEHRLLRVGKNSLVVAGPDGSENVIEAQRVVVAIGIRQDDTIHQQIKSLGYETHVIGDCLEPRTAKSAIYEGAKLGRSI
ncbi:MAG: FAD-dependent oxidoreductase [Desulfobacterales bacterium]|jgi:2,4-dienoyl-CoA reductase-like NADH-dependent reductase (Old Yellow Enzyme family)/thioredoxin reductase